MIIKQNSHLITASLSLALLAAGGFFTDQARSEVVSSSIKRPGEPLDKASIEALSRVPTAILTNGVSELTHFVQYRNNIFIPVSVNGCKPSLFWVDTGGGTSFINSRHPEYRKILQGITKKHVINVENSNHATIETVSLYNCPSLMFSGIELRDVAIETKESNDYDTTIFNETGLEVCGMLGTTALRALVNEINYPQGTIRFYSPSTFHPKATTVKSCAFTVQPTKGNLPYVKAQVNDGPLVEFDFDTGCSSTLRLSADLLQLLGIDGNDKPMMIQKIKLGQLTLENIPSAKSSYPFSIIGYGIFRNYRLTIDYSRGMIYFE